MEQPAATDISGGHATHPMSVNIKKTQQKGLQNINTQTNIHMQGSHSVHTAMLVGTGHLRLALKRLFYPNVLSRSKEGPAVST